MKFRKKPVVIEAIQYDGFHTGELNDFCENTIYEPCGGAPVIRTPDGDMPISNGDWIIKVVNVEFYTCNPDVFRKTYEPVKD